MSQTAKEYCDSIIAGLIGHKVDKLELEKTYQVLIVSVDANTIQMRIDEIMVTEIDIAKQKMYVYLQDVNDKGYILFKNIGNYYRFFDTEQQAYNALDAISDYIENVMLAKKI